jgi:uncharacterized membrane protein
MSLIGKYILLIGIFLVITGLVLWFFGDKLSWLGNLPGDIKIKRDNFSFYFPITTMIIVSLILSFILWLARKLFF